MTRILIVDDDPGLRGLISTFLDRHGYRTDTAGNPPEMRAKLAAGTYDLIVLDVMMPQEDGLTALKGLVAGGGPPVIMLSAVGGDVDRIVGLEMGAEDYMEKPCNPRELLARIRTVLRRSRGAAAPVEPVPTSPAPVAVESWIGFAGWRMQPDSRMISAPSGQDVTLSDAEFRLLRALVDHPRRVLTRDQLLDFAHGESADHFDRAIDVQISRLRRKLAAADDSAELIRTVRNEGYMFVPAVTR
ncbi:MAG: response regulator [Niveispirillum sp.]|uniref:response regulator n=1 Tax=Alphaproteobacteria TaxID=28211 RepID=UPI0026350A9D|nr:response regulator transcription factor [Asticcacaulis sp.]